MVSKWLVGLTPGETIRVKLGAQSGLPRMAWPKSLGLIAGGTGITPMLQILFQLARDGLLSSLKVSLVYTNRAVEDILMKKAIDAFAAEHRVRVFYVLSDAPAEWNGGKGHIDSEMLKAHLEPPSPGTVVLCCGPPAMHESITSIVDELGYDMSRFHEFK